MYGNTNMGQHQVTAADGHRFSLMASGAETAYGTRRIHTHCLAIAVIKS